MADLPYVHGYSARESTRLTEQAIALSELLHRDTVYLPGSLVLECGCATGAQTVFLACNSEARIVSLDFAPAAVAEARRRIRAAGRENVEFLAGDVFNLPFAERSFDHAFVCFFLEHLPDAVRALRLLLRALRPGGSITVIEGDHGSWYCYPSTAEARRTVECLIEIQARLGGDSLIGRRLYPLLSEAGFQGVEVSPRMVYVDASRPGLVEGFSKNTFIAMVEGVREQALSLGLMDPPAWDKGIADMYRATERDGTFCYTFFKATAVRCQADRS